MCTFILRQSRPPFAIDVRIAYSNSLQDKNLQMRFHNGYVRVAFTMVLDHRVVGVPAAHPLTSMLRLLNSERQSEDASNSSA